MSIPLYSTDFSSAAYEAWPFHAMPIGSYADFTHPAAAAAYALYRARGGPIGCAFNHERDGTLVTRIAKFDGIRHATPHPSLVPLHPLYSIPLGEVRTFSPGEMPMVKRALTWYASQFGAGAYRRSANAVARVLMVGLNNTYGDRTL